jgi:hypothetical protein
VVLELESGLVKRHRWERSMRRREVRNSSAEFKNKNRSFDPRRFVQPPSRRSPYARLK